MAKYIEDIHKRIRRALRKGLTGYVSPEDIDSEIYAEVINLWLKDLQQFERTQIISMVFRRYVKPFGYTSQNLLPSNTDAEGLVVIKNVIPDLPDHRYHVDCYSDTGKLVTVLTLGEYRQRFNHPFKGPSVAFPIAKFEGDNFVISPKVGFTITLIQKPIKQKFAYTPVSSTKLTYDDGNSIDIDLDTSLHDQLVNRVIENISISMREGSLVQYTQLQKAQEGK
jgi:hypothetical protein